MVWFAPDMPAYQVHASVNSCPESHLIADLSVTIDESSHGGKGSITALEMLPFVKVGQHTTDIDGPVAKLSQLPVEYEEPVRLLARAWILPLCIRKQHTDAQNINFNLYQTETNAFITYLPDQKSPWISPQLPSSPIGGSLSSNSACTATFLLSNASKCPSTSPG